MSSHIISPIDIAQLGHNVALPSLLVIEPGANEGPFFAQLEQQGFIKVADVIGIMDALDAGARAIAYVEAGDMLDARVETFVSDFSAGIVSFFDAHRHSLRTIKFDPAQILFIIIAAREQIEKSSPGLFEYFGAVDTVK